MTVSEDDMIDGQAYLIDAVTGDLTDYKGVDSQDLLSDPGDVQSEPEERMISRNVSPEVLAVAHRHAAEDRALLARLVREGQAVRRDGDYELRHPQVARPFVRDIEAMVRPRVNLAIRPKSKKRRK